MKRKRYTDEQIAFTLRQAEVRCHDADGGAVPEANQLRNFKRQ